MPIVVVGGHSRNVGKTSVVAGLIAGLPQYPWTAIKITQFGHGICALKGSACKCAVDHHRWAIEGEHDRSGRTDTSRFLVAGAQRALWVRTKAGELAFAMPDLRAEIAADPFVIVESNSLLGFINPDLYLTVIDPVNTDFKASAREYLDRADAILLVKRTVGLEIGVAGKIDPTGAPEVDDRLEAPDLATVQSREFETVAVPDFETVVAPDFQSGVTDHDTPPASAAGCCTVDQDKLAPWPEVSLESCSGRPIFSVSPPTFITAELLEFVAGRLTGWEGRNVC